VGGAPPSQHQGGGDRGQHGHPIGDRWQYRDRLRRLTVEIADGRVLGGSACSEPRRWLRRLTVEIADGRFTDEDYDAQPGQVILIVRAEGGPYTLSVHQLAQPTELSSDRPTEVWLTAPDAGAYTMRLQGASTDTETLNVRPLGGR
jgi:hypothetical protein